MQIYRTFPQNKVGELILEGPRNKKTGLWEIPLTKSSGTEIVNRNTVQQPRVSHRNTVKQPRVVPIHRANNVYDQRTTMPDIIAYLQAATGYPTLRTWLQAIANKKFITWPGITVKTVGRHLKNSIVTAKGHLTHKKKSMVNKNSRND